MSDRTQGRPARGAAQVGREKILAEFRDLLRSNHGGDLSRKAIARYVGVTPALISYYFPKKQQLLEEAVIPIVTAYADEICQVVETKACADYRTKEVISILMRLYKQDGNLLELYQGTIEKPRCVPDQLAKMTSALTQLFPPKDGEQSTSQLDAAIFQGALWGMCRFASQITQSLEDEASGHGLERHLAEKFFRVTRQQPIESELAAVA